MTYYDILGVPQTASTQDIKTAYRKLAQEFHPDKLAGIPPAVAKLAEEKFKDVQEAYEILTKHRAEYNEQLKAVGAAAQPPPPPPKAKAAAPPRASSQAPGRPVPKKNTKNIWYLCGRFIREIPWAGRIVFGVAFVFVIAAIVTSNNAPETPPAGQQTTQGSTKNVSQVSQEEQSQLEKDISAAKTWKFIGSPSSLSSHK